jgi:AmmeMemoRadiSam system protein A
VHNGAEAELTALARRAISEHLAGGHLDPAGFRAVPSSGVFVTLRERDGSLRGCIGSVHPVESSLGAEVARSAALAATLDPRFAPVTGEELAELSVEVSVLSAPEQVDGIESLDPARFGVIVRASQGRQGLLLPGIPGIDDAATQVEVARRKAGISKTEPVSLCRFIVRKWTDAR